MLKDVWQEVYEVFWKRQKVLDALVPPIAFITFDGIYGQDMALAIGFSIAFFFVLFRVIRGQRILYAVSGLFGVALSVIFVVLLDSSKGYFFPQIARGGLTAGILLLSVLVNRPLVAYSSQLARGWPLEWYWHPKVLPAYREVTLLWVLFFGGRTFVQYAVYSQLSLQEFGILNIFLGLPSVLVLLLVSYVYGLKRLQHLKGPSVEEFEEGKTSGWRSQQKGF